MPDEAPALDPALASTAEEYVGLLRKLRDRSGLTYRQLQRRAEAAGEILPPSTAASALARSSLPREELVVALVRACGAGTEEVDRWVAARARIAEPDGTAMSAAPAGPDEPVGRQSAPPRRFPFVAVLVTAVVAAGVTAAAFRWLGGSEPTATGGVSSPAVTAPGTTTPPTLGRYRFRAAHSGLCLSERRGQKSGTVYQADCATAIPAMRLRLIQDGLYQIETDHPDYGAGCSGVAGSSLASGAPLEDGECDRPAAKEFGLEPLDEPAGAFRLRLPHSRLCVGVLDASTAAWAMVVQLPCVPGAAGQAFYLDPVATDATTVG